MTNDYQDKQDRNDPFEFGKLPQMDPPTNLWPAIDAGLDAPARGGMFRWASAASIAVVLIIAVFVMQQPGEQMPVGPVQSGDPSHLDRLVTVSQKMETRLSDSRAGSGMMNTDQAGTIAEFEDLIAFIDQQLSDEPESVDLWFQRVSLMSDLLNVYAVQQSGDMGMIASL